MRIMQRKAADDFYALLTANAMESAGASVFCITQLPTWTSSMPWSVFSKGSCSSHGGFIVWAKVENDDMIDMVDVSIENESSRWADYDRME